MYYNTYIEKDSLAKKDSFVDYVNSLREQFTIRVEVKRVVDPGINVNKISHQSIRTELEKYLVENVSVENYHIQKDTGYNGWFYTWFMDREDAVAFILKFNGTVI